MIKLNLKSAYLQGKLHSSKKCITSSKNTKMCITQKCIMHSFKEFKKNCISQVISDTIQKCICISKYYTAQVCIAQGFTVHTAWFFVKCKSSNSYSVQMDKEIYMISSHWCERTKSFLLLHCVISISTLFSENSFKQQNKSSCPSVRLNLNYANLL